MGDYNLVDFPRPDELADAVARAWVQDLRTIGQQTYCVALSGGRIARQVFSASAALIKSEGLKLDAVEFFWGDERCVPPTDPESNYRLAHELLLAPLSISEQRIHRIRGEEPPDFAATEAEAELCRIAKLDDDGQPILDLVFLGMGEDGHVASLFPQEPEEVRDSKAVFRPVTATKPPPKRITIGYQPLAKARKVWVIASGAGKQEALRASLSPGGATPLARALKSRKSTTIYTDIPR